MLIQRLLPLLIALPPTIHAKSQIALFSDAQCQHSLRGLEGPNGYPNGTCTDLRRAGPYGSFHVVGLDPGCTVTIYTNDASGDVCSASAHQEEIQLIDCYNSTYVYYSIDFCDPGAARDEPVPPAAAPAAAPAPVGAIAGGVVGGVVVLGIVLYLVFMIVVRRRRARYNVGPVEVSGDARHESYFQELDGGRGKYECAAVEVKRYECAAVEAAVEIDGREMKG